MEGDYNFEMTIQEIAEELHFSEQDTRMLLKSAMKKVQYILQRNANLRAEFRSALQ